jgi:hypothetical protein
MIARKLFLIQKTAPAVVIYELRRDNHNALGHILSAQVSLAQSVLLFI